MALHESSEIAKSYVRAVQDMYKECTTAIRTAVGSLQVKVGLNQGSALRVRPARRYMDGIMEDMEITGVRKKMVDDQETWRGLIRCGDPE